MVDEDEEPKGFRVTDKRKVKRQEPAESAAEAKVLGDNAGVHVGAAHHKDEPPIDFGSFVLSLAHGALVAMGIVEHPEVGGVMRDLDAARQSIQILEMLSVKTQGNLDPEEEKLLGSLLYELRLSYVEVSAQKV